jgi:Protein of unknown function (DUF1571)
MMRPKIRSFRYSVALSAAAIVLACLTFAGSARAQAAQGSQGTMEQAIALLDQARLQFQAVEDYECRLIKQERVDGVLLPPGVMIMKVRNRPFSVYLRSLSPEADRGMEVSYVEGRDRGMMRVRPPHIMGVLGFWSIDTQDVRAFEKNRHCIKEAGIGNLLESTARCWDMERRLRQTLVHILDEDLNGRACTRIETIHPDHHAGQFYGYRCELWLDKASHLPAGAETYDWPTDQSPGNLLESYRYLELRCNIGLSDRDFPR